MDNRYNIDNLEKFIKEKADEFVMYPSKKVWYSIYNSMHPGSRLPSVTMSVALLSILLIAGLLNTKSKVTTTSQNQHYSKDLIIATINNPTVDNTRIDTDDINLLTTNNTNTSIKPVAVNNSFIKEYNWVDNKKKKSNSTLIAFAKNESVAISITDVLPTSLLNERNSVKETTVASNQILDAAGIVMPIATNNNEVIATTEDEKEIAKTIASSTDKVDNNNEVINTLNNDKAWIEYYAMYNKPAPKKWKGKLGWQLYVTPSIVYRTLYNNAAGKFTNINAAYGNYNNSDIDNVVNNKPSVGLEAGLGLQYDASASIKIKGGIQLNYTRYNAMAYENHHPISTSVILNNDDNKNAYEVFKSSPYSNTSGLISEKLHNETYQVSLPIGADVKLSESESVSWYMGATIQPTYIIAARSYLISANRANYIKDNSYLNHFNLNASFETYVSFKKGSYTWQIGPQFRSQLFTTNSKIYSIEEKLFNCGIKLGISKKF